MISGRICFNFIAQLIAPSVFTSPSLSLLFSLPLLCSFKVGSLVKESASVLMQRSPKELDTALTDCYQKVMALEGVQGVQVITIEIECTYVPLKCLLVSYEL